MQVMGGQGSDMFEYFKILMLVTDTLTHRCCLQVMGGQGSDMFEYFKILMLVTDALTHRCCFQVTDVGDRHLNTQVLICR